MAPIKPLAKCPYVEGANPPLSNQAHKEVTKLNER